MPLTIAQPKGVNINGTAVTAVATPVVNGDGSVVVVVAATCGGVTYAESWTLPTDNPNYTQAQAQIDYAAHVAKVANGAAGRAIAQALVNGLV